MGDLDTEQIYKVIATAGLYLRKGPIKSETNSILLMVDGTIVTREGDEVRAGSNHQWYKVRFIDENRDIVGWAAIGYLELQYPLGISGELPIDNNPPPPP